MNLHPLADRSLLTVAVTYGLLLKLALSAGLFGIWLGLLVMLSLWRYGYEVLRHVAQGREQIPLPELESMNPVGEFGLLGHFLAISGLIVIWFAVTRWIGDGLLAGSLRWAGWLAVVAAFPASAALMGLTGNLWYSLSPASIAGVVRTLRHRYPMLLLACGALFLLFRLVQQLLSEQSGLLLSLSSQVLMVWVLLAAFALIGAAIRECRDEFYIPGEAESREERVQRQLREDRIRDWQRSLDRAYGLISSGLVGEAYRTLRQLVEEEGYGLDVYQWLFDNTLTWQDKTHALQIGGRFIERLIQSGEPHAALEVFAQCRRVSTDFTVPAEQAAVLAGYARSIGRHGLADELTGGSKDSS